MKTELAVTFALLLLPSAISAQEAKEVRLIGDSDEYRAGYRQGVEEAKKELESGVATFYTCGLQLGLEHLDRETGIPIRPIAGCGVDDEILGRSFGHNKTLSDSMKLRGLPANSFKRWEKELFGLEAYFIARSKQQAPVRPKAGGPVLKSPDGKFTITPVRSEYKRQDGSTGNVFALIVGGDGVKPSTVNVWWDDVDLVWGPNGSRFAVLRNVQKEWDKYDALDLQRGEWLRQEMHLKNAPSPSR